MLLGMILTELEGVLQARADADPAESYTARLLVDREFNQRKIMEEAFEVCLELGRDPIGSDRVANEAADLIYHLMVGLVAAGVPLDAVFAVLEERRR
jgi:phosphoribosyl-ATP pyrophosphohydrolase